MAKDLNANPEENQDVAKVVPLVQSAMTFADARNVHWSCVVPRDTTRQMLTLSSFWSLCSTKPLHAFDRITVIAADRSFYAEMLVLDAGVGFANVIELAYHPLPALLAVADSLPAGFEARYQGPEQGERWGVIRLADNVRVVTGHSSRDEALKALLAHASLKS